MSAHWPHPWPMNGSDPNYPYYQGYAHPMAHCLKLLKSHHFTFSTDKTSPCYLFLNCFHHDNVMTFYEIQYLLELIHNYPLIFLKTSATANLQGYLCQRNSDHCFTSFTIMKLNARCILGETMLANTVPWNAERTALTFINNFFLWHQYRS